MPRRPRRAEMVADATLVAVAGVRQSVKNVMLVRTLRDKVDFDAEWYADAVRHELEMLAAETEADAVRLSGLIARARHREGVAYHAADYRSVDRRGLKRRRRILLDLAGELRRLKADDDFVTELIGIARARALDEIASTAASVPGLGRVKPARGLERSRALQELRDELRDYDD